MDFKKLNKLANRDPEYVADVILTKTGDEFPEEANHFIQDLVQDDVKLLSKKHTTKNDYITIACNCKSIREATIISHIPEDLETVLGYPEVWSNYITKTRAKHIYVVDDTNAGGPIPVMPDVAKQLIKEVEK